MDSWVQPFLKPPGPHLASNHSPTLESDSLARKGRPSLLKTPQITEEKPEFPSPNTFRCSNPRPGWGGQHDEPSEDGVGLPGREGEFQCF